MRRFTHNLKQIWQAEQTIRKQELRVGVLKIILVSIAGLIFVMGLVMLDLAAFFALVPRIGKPLAALSVTGINVGIALLLILKARCLKPPAGIEMLRQARDMAREDVENGVELASDAAVSRKQEIEHFIRHPGEALLPAVGPLLMAIVNGLNLLKSKRAEAQEKAAPEATAPEADEPSRA